MGWLGEAGVVLVPRDSQEAGVSHAVAKDAGEQVPARAAQLSVENEHCWNMNRRRGTDSMA